MLIPHQVSLLTYFKKSIGDKNKNLSYFDLQWKKSEGANLDLDS